MSHTNQDPMRQLKKVLLAITVLLLPCFGPSTSTRADGPQILKSSTKLGTKSNVTVGQWQTELHIRKAGRRIERAADSFEKFIDRIVERRPVARAPIVVRVTARPRDFRRAWWRSRVRRALASGKAKSSLSIHGAINRALKHSHQIAVFGRIPAIRETGIAEAWGRYRPELFLEAKREQRNDPAKSLAQAGGIARARYNEKVLEGGIRSRIITGAEVVLSHRASRYKTNQIEHDPLRQGRQLTSLTVVQPLLRDGGIRHGRRIIRVAELDSEVAMQEFVRQAEQHLLEIVRAYWTIYRSRAVYLQKRKLARSASRLISRLKSRTTIDVDPVQLSRAQAAASSRTTDLLRARTAIKNAELRLLSLINDPAFDRSRSGELLVRDRPKNKGLKFNRRSLLREALLERPELRQAFAQFRAALVREGIAGNETLPQLDLILEGSHHTGSHEKRFPDHPDNKGKFGYTAGVRFSVPLGTDERRARYGRRRIETIQQQHQVRAAIETVGLEIDVSANELIVAKAELGARFIALSHAQRELDTIQSRWRAGSQAESGLTLLTALLDAQERLQAAEEAAASAETTLEVARENLLRARGGYLEHRKIIIAPDNGYKRRKTYKLQHVHR